MTATDPTAPTDPPAPIIVQHPTVIAPSAQDGRAVARPNPFAPRAPLREMGPSRPPEPAPEPAAPDPEVKRLGDIARASCGCQACTGSIRPTHGGHQRSRVDGAPLSCVANSAFAELAARAGAK